MAKNVKIVNTEITRVNNDIKKQIEELENIYSELIKNGALIRDSWKSQAAIGYANVLESNKEQLQSNIKKLEDEIELITKTSKKIIEKDISLKKKITANL